MRILNDYHLPLLHLGSGNIDTICLTATAHGEVNIERGKSRAQVTLGNDVESSGVVENVIVKSEVTAGKYLALNLTMTRNAG